MQTLPYYGLFALSLGKELKPNIFPKFNLPYMDTHYYGHFPLCIGPSVSVLMWFDCIN